MVVVYFYIAIEVVVVNPSGRDQQEEAVFVLKSARRCLGEVEQVSHSVWMVQKGYDRMICYHQVLGTEVVEHEEWRCCYG